MGDMIWRNCLVYLDDITVFSSIYQEYIEIIEALFRCLQVNNLKLKAFKC